MVHVAVMGEPGEEGPTRRREVWARIPGSHQLAKGPRAEATALPEPVCSAATWRSTNNQNRGYLPSSCYVPSTVLSTLYRYDFI